MSRVGAAILEGGPATERVEVRPRLAWRAEAVRLGVAIVAALVTLTLRLPELDRYATIDESRWVGRSADFAAYLEGRDWDKTFVVGHPGVTTMWLGSLGLGPEGVRAFSFLEGQTDVTRRDGYLAALVSARRAVVVANALALGAAVWLSWGLFGAGAALLGGLLLLLDPFYAAHSRFIHLDALLSSFMLLAALASIGFWNGRGWGYVLAAGVFSGLALLTKAPSVYLLAFVPALALFEHVRGGGWRTRRSWLRLAGGLAVWLAVAWGVGVALWPFFRVKGVAAIQQMLDFAQRNSGSERDNFFFGRPVEDPGPLFYPVALLFRATPLMMLGLVLLAWAATRWRQRSPAFWPAVLLGAYVLGFVLMMTLGQKKFDRYLLPAFPALDLLAGVGVWLGWRAVRWGVGEDGRLKSALGGGVTDHGLKPMAWRGVLPLILATASAAWPLASVYPYDLAYYNPLLGGGAAAQRVLFVGWGEGLDRVAAYLNGRPLVLEAPTAASAYHRALQAHLNGYGAMPLDRAEQADYIVPYVNSIQRNQDAEVLRPLLEGQEPEHVVWINGIEYARVYRGPRLPVDRPIGERFGDRVRLESAVFAPGSGRVRVGEEFVVRLRWQVSGEPGALSSVLRLVGPNGAAVLQERRPLAEALREGPLLMVDARLGLAARLPVGEYRLEASVEDPVGGALITSNGERDTLVQRVTLLQPAPNR